MAAVNKISADYLYMKSNKKLLTSSLAMSLALQLLDRILRVQICFRKKNVINIYSYD